MLRNRSTRQRNVFKRENARAGRADPRDLKFSRTFQQQNLNNASSISDALTLSNTRLIRATPLNNVHGTNFINTAWDEM